MTDPPDPAISVVMPVYNAAALVGRAIASVRRQTFPWWELVAADDGSTDGSAALLTQLAAEDPRVRVVRLPANRGPSAARNAALAATRGPFIAYLDADDEFYPDHLKRVWDWRGRGDVLMFQYDLVEERPGSPRLGSVTVYDPAARYDAMFAETIAVPLGVAHRRDLIGRSGGFDESLWRDEDGDLWRRFARAGASFTFVPHRSGLYHVRSDSLSRTAPPGPGLPSPVVTVTVRAGADEYPVRIPRDEAQTISQVFHRGEYAGVPTHLLRPRPTVLDVGANVGTFALYAKLRIHRDAVVHCFEPYPPAADLLRRNVARLPGVAVHPVALGRTDGEVDLLLDPRWAVCNSVRPALVPRPAGTARVRVRDAGAVWDELGLVEVDVLKVDTEGCEIDILEALGPRLAAVRVALVEFHTPADRRRVDALFPGHELFGSSLHSHRVGVVKYVRADLLDC